MLRIRQTGWLLIFTISETYSWPHPCWVKVEMTLKIEKKFDDQRTVICLSGRLQSECLDELRMQLMTDRRAIALDLEGVTLVDVEVVQFLNACKSMGIELLHCSRYVREWMLREINREGEAR